MPGYPQWTILLCATEWSIMQVYRKGCYTETSLFFYCIFFITIIFFFLRGWVGRLYIANVTDVNSTDTDPIRAVWSGSALFAKVSFEDARVWSEFLFESIRSHFDQLKLILVHGSCNEEPDLSFLKEDDFYN